MPRMPHLSPSNPDIRQVGGVQINVNRLRVDDLDVIEIERSKMRAGGVEVTFTRSYLEGTRERRGVAFFEAREDGPYVFKQMLVIPS